MKTVFKVYQIVAVHGQFEHSFHKTLNTIPDAANPKAEMSGFETEEEAESWISKQNSMKTFTIVKEYTA